MLQTDVIHIPLASSSNHFLAYGEIQKDFLVDLVQYIIFQSGTGNAPRFFDGARVSIGVKGSPCV